MTRLEQRTQKLIEQLGNVGDLVSDRSRSEAAEVKRAARTLTSLLKRRSATKVAAKTPAGRRSAAATAAKTGRKASTAQKRGATRLTKDGRSISEVRRAAAHKAWETKRSNARKRGRRSTV
jgi:hypothetical protein